MSYYYGEGRLKTIKSGALLLATLYALVQIIFIMAKIDSESKTFDWAVVFLPTWLVSSIGSGILLSELWSVKQDTKEFLRSALAVFLVIGGFATWVILLCVKLQKASLTDTPYTTIGTPLFVSLFIATILAFINSRQSDDLDL